MNKLPSSLPPPPVPPKRIPPRAPTMPETPSSKQQGPGIAAVRELALRRAER